MKEKKIKRRLTFKGFILIALFLYLVVMLGYFIYKMPVKRIIIKGNALTTDEAILKSAAINNKTSIWQISSHQVKKNITALDFISDVKVKRHIWGNVVLEVKEEKVLFFYEAEAKYYLSNQTLVKTEQKVNGIPTLINYVPSDLLKNFGQKFAQIDNDIIQMISEINYDPDINGEITIDDSRFFLKMNDGNSLYINIVNMEKLAKYKEYIASIGTDEKGILYLDSNSSSIIFKTYAKINSEKEEKANEDELSEDAPGVSE